MENKQSVSVGICDDDPVMLAYLEKMCHQILDGSYTLTARAATDPEALFAENLIWDIALLDVQLDKKTEGIDLARRILLENPRCRIIFVSSFTNVVSTVYQVPHYCLILKDQIDTQLPKFLSRAVEESVRDRERMLLVRFRRKIRSISVSDIVYLERQGHTTNINLIGGEVVSVRDKICELLERLPESSFCRCHVSYVVNLAQIDGPDGHYIRMKCGQQIPVSNTYQENMWDRYSRYLCHEN